MLALCEIIASTLDLEHGENLNKYVKINLFSDDFNQDSLSSQTVEFSIKDLLPCAEI